MLKEKFYQPPYAEVVEIESESVFAASQSTLDDFYYDDLEALVRR